jgi:hypothetical protein
MSDERLLQLMVNLADALLELPPGPRTSAARQSVMALIQHLTTAGLLPRDGQWLLGPKSVSDRPRLKRERS